MYQRSKFFSARQHPVTLYVCVVSLLVSCFAAVFQRGYGAPLFDWMVFNAQAAWRGEIWRFVTYVFVHTTPSALFWDMLVFYLLARSAEEHWGARDFGVFLFWTALGSSVLSLPFTWCVTTLLPVVAAGYAEGFSCLINALLVSFVLTRPDTSLLFGFVLPVSGHTFLWVMLLMEIVSGLYGGVTGLGMTLAGMCMGWLLTKGAWRWSYIMGKIKKRKPLRKRGLYVVYPHHKNNTLH